MLRYDSMFKTAYLFEKAYATLGYSAIGIWDHCIPHFCAIEIQILGVVKLLTQIYRYSFRVCNYQTPSSVNRHKKRFTTGL